MLAPHVGDRAEGAEAVAPLGDLEVGQVLRRDPEPGPVVLGLDGGGPEDGPLLVEVAHDPVGDLGDLLAAEDADDLVDLRHLLQEHLPLPLGQAPGDDDPLDLAPARLRSSISRITPSDSCRAASMNPQVLMMTRSAAFESGTRAYPSWARSPSIRSESTRFFGQPRLTKEKVPLRSRSSAMLDAIRYQ